MPFVGKCKECKKLTEINELSINHGICHKCKNSLNDEIPFSNDLTINDIIRKIKDRRIKLIENLYEPDSPANVPSRINELNDLLKYIKNDGDY